MKHLFHQRNARGYPDEPLLAATQTKGVVRKEDYENRTVLALKDLQLLKLVEIGDFVISLRSFQGGIEYARHRGIISPAYTILFPAKDDTHGYFAALFKSQPFIDALKLYVTGIRQGQNIDYVKLSRSYLPVPPSEERETIAGFVRNLDQRCRRFIRNRRRLIAVLNEQKQAIINQAVTRGLDPDVPLVDSGENWFKKLPSEWTAAPLRRVIKRAVDGPHHSPKYTNDGIMFLSARNIKVDRWSLSDAKFISQEDYEDFSKRIKPQIGDVLYTKGGTTGVARAVDLDFPFQVWVHVAVLKLSKEVVSPHYLALVLNSTPCYEQSQLFTRGATNQDLGLGRMKNITIALPKNLEEQEKIVQFTKKQTRNILNLIGRINREISLIQEYRTRLIADVVTGQVDVRHLPTSPGAEIEIEDLADPLDPMEDEPGTGAFADETGEAFDP